jgi:hypothetical protein
MKNVYTVESYIKFEAPVMMAIFETYEEAKALVDKALIEARTLEVDSRFEFVDYFFIKEYEVGFDSYDWEADPETWSFEV